jgi:hypothetical protein
MTLPNMNVMRGLILLLFLTNVHPWRTDAGEVGSPAASASAPSREHRAVKGPAHGGTFAEVIGINGNLGLAETCGGTSPPNSLAAKAGLFRKCRTFYLLEHDLHGVPLKQRMPKPCLSDCGRITQGWSDGNAAWKSRFCNLHQRFPVNFATLETIRYPDGRGGVILKKYPDKSLTVEEMGDPYRAGYGVGHYLAQSLDGLINILEVWNEPHGAPGIPAHNAWARGIADALRANHSHIELCTSDRTASGYEFFGSRKINTRIQDVDLSLYQHVSVHNYVFDEHFALTVPPEKSSGRFYSLFTECRDMHRYLQGRGKQWHLTEFGYSSVATSEETQAAYLLRAILIAMRFGASSVLIYHLQDEPWAAPFDGCGLLTHDGKEKRVYREMRKLLERYGDYWFLRVVQEDEQGAFVYEFTNGKQVARFSWRVNETTLPAASTCRKSTGA